MKWGQQDTNLKDNNLVAGFRLRALLVHEVFDKVLFLTPSARARFTSGRVFNLVRLLNVLLVHEAHSS